MHLCALRRQLLHVWRHKSDKSISGTNIIKIQCHYKWKLEIFFGLFDLHEQDKNGNLRHATFLITKNRKEFLTRNELKRI